ncbi:hypothetical protein FHU41_000133 [Psychromicrobium silvestre]|uniref:DUF3224 domain-containing protein n=1 Tax=Psychromicrobium silvestre TaxID=1645614 RepID=A0A7Y9LQV5_9MICC|nr:DUF3224 domain-containing protein [Psychromicrobium silvestre]NYE93912.1 hypothetical protein [Psychromicrobium silvestre]
MISESIFTVSDFTPVDTVTEIVSALPAGYARMNKTYSGEVVGRSITQFTSAFDQDSGTGSYFALETFEGTVAGKSGVFAFLHSASTTGSDRSDEFSLIVPHSGTGELTGIAGNVQLIIDDDGTHRMIFDYTL